MHVVYTHPSLWHGIASQMLVRGADDLTVCYDEQVSKLRVYTAADTDGE